ncbi:MAG TPA: hypothetical protein VJ853_09890, partial [Thermoanaerobaculia bacterium]|nr:hypothetical protein [Thermoanaerobaculia bacterium]
MAPVTTPMAAVKARAPEVHVTPTTNDFVSPKAEPDPLADTAHATEIAEEKGWLRDAFFDFNSSALRS